MDVSIHTLRMWDGSCFMEFVVQMGWNFGNDVIENVITVAEISNSMVKYKLLCKLYLNEEIINIMTVCWV